MRILLLLIGLYLVDSVTSTLSAQSIPWTRCGGLFGGQVSGISVKDGKNMFVTVRTAGIYGSTNGGATWGLRGSGTPTPYVFECIVVTSKGTLLAGTGQQDIWRSIDNGYVWKRVGTTDVSAQIYGLGVSPHGFLFAGTSKGVYRSEDDGLTWVHVSNLIEDGNHVHCITVLRNGYVVACTSTGIYRSSDDGVSWTRVCSDIAPSSIVEDRMGNIYVGGIYVRSYQPCGVWGSLDTALTWKPMGTTLADVSARPLGLDPSGFVIVFVIDGGLFKTTDGGQEWSQIPTSFGKSRVWTLVANGADSLIAGTDCGVHTSIDGGRTWKYSSVGLPWLTPTALEAQADGRILAGTDGCGVFASSNHGASWTLLGEGVPSDITTIKDFEAEGIFVGSESYGLYRSTDGGESWASSDSGMELKQIRDLFRGSNGTLFAETGSRTFFSSTDGGGYWRPFTLGIADVRCIAFPSTDWLFIGTANGAYRSSNEGVDLERIDPPSWTSPFVVKIVVADADLVYASTSNNTMYRTRDMGNSWGSVYNQYGGSGQIATAAVDSAGEVALGLSSGVVALIRPSDSMFVPASNGLPKTTINDLVYSSDGFLYAATPLGVYRTRGLFATAVGPDPPHVTEMGLEQNYPNPFNSSTLIRYTVSDRSHVTLAVYNTLGQQVAILQNGEEQPGNHELQFDASELPTGVYFYRLRAGSYSETKKCLFLR